MRRHLAILGVVVSCAAGAAIRPRHGLPAGARLPSGSPLGLAVRGGRAAILAPGPGGRPDVFLVPVRVAPGGVVLSAGEPRNVTETRFAAEESLARDGDFVTFETRLEDRVLSTERIDLAPPAPRRGGSLERAAFALVAWQRTGDPSGLCRERSAGDRSTTSCDSDAHVDLFRFAVDQARYQILGPARLQRLEMAWFVVKDAFDGLVEGLGEPAAHAEALGTSPPRPAPPGGRLPPANVVPILAPPEPGEGEWRPRDPAFSPVSDDGRALFWSTFVRPDRDRPSRAVVYLTAWDPADLELGMRAGTVEPKSVTGAIGDGRIPRDEVDRLAAAFNGGFQTADGGYGMRVREERWLPPIPWASTVAVTADGRIGLGSWPPPGPGEETADAPYPTYRQNLHPLVEDGVVNPFKRRFWGGVPIGMHASSTNRTGLGITREGLLVYAWGVALSPETLAAAMARAGCTYAMMLDMNFANTEFELYRVGGSLPRLDRPIDPEWEIEGRMPGRPDLAYRAERMVRGMSRKGFPRYADVDSRDFMYLLRRRETIAPEGEGWRALEGRPPAGWAKDGAWRWHPTWARPAWTIDAAAVPEPFGLMVDGRVERPPVPGLPTLALYRSDEGVVARIGRWGEDLPAGAAWLVQGERARAGEPSASIDEAGLLWLERGGTTSARSLWLPVEPSRLAMVPAERAAAFRLFPDTQPVRPRIWFADHWRRAEALGIWGDVDRDSAAAVVQDD